MSNLKARDALERAQRLFRERPSAAKKNVPATATMRDGLKCEISGPEDHKVATDMPKAVGGSDFGPSPGWLLRAALASCTATAISMRAAIRGIELRELQVTVHAETDVRGAVGIEGVSLALSDIRISIKLGAQDVPETTLREIVEWGASQSTVSATLREGRHLATEVTIT